MARQPCRRLAHPRSRGENKEGTVIKNRELGSSPLTRGKQTSLRGDKTGLRLIPAHAGKTRRPRSSRAGGPAHPRSRGENSGMASRPRSTTGSSPLTRGKQAPTMIGRGPPRLIPAHAGKTAANWSATFLAAAHPRSRGENETLTLRIGEREGSSPLTRGKRWYVFVDRFAVMAHPRSRGENPRRPRGATVRAGSSPLTRGKPSSCTLRPRTTRLIPAHAGKT